VEFGTAHRARQEQSIAGKTGTCTEGHTHLGWFGSFNVGSRKLVVVVLLTGGQPAIGARAAGIAGAIYRRLSHINYFATGPQILPATIIPSPINRFRKHTSNYGVSARPHRLGSGADSSQ
jgi:hypothetical protein